MANVSDGSHDLTEWRDLAADQRVGPDHLSNLNLVDNSTQLPMLMQLISIDGVSINVPPATPAGTIMTMGGNKFTVVPMSARRHELAAGLRSRPGHDAELARRGVGHLSRRAGRRRPASARSHSELPAVHPRSRPGGRIMAQCRFSPRRVCTTPGDKGCRGGQRPIQGCPLFRGYFWSESRSCGTGGADDDLV